MKLCIRLAAVFFLLLLQACGPSEEEGMAPEDVALNFFTAIYNDGDVEKAQSFSGDELYELLGHYRNITAVKRHVIGMEIENPKIEVKDSSADFFRRLQEDVKVELHFTTKVDGRTYKDIRVVLVGKVNDHLWQVKKVLADPFATNG